MFTVECAKCQVKSPETESSVVMPAGWTAVPVRKGIMVETTFRCPAHEEPKEKKS